MPIISKVDAKSPRGKLVYAIILTLLTIGGATMIYPFLVMASGSVRSEMDETDLSVLPPYLVDEDVLYRKFLETKYNQKVEALNSAHGIQTFDFQNAPVPETISDTAVADFAQFLQEVNPPHHWQMLGGAEGNRTIPERLRELRNRLEARFEGDMDAFGRNVGSTITNWSGIRLATPAWLSVRFDYTPNALWETYFEMLDEAPWPERQLVSLSGAFVETMLIPKYGRRDVEAYNRAHQQPIQSLAQYVLPPRVPQDPTLREEWSEFAREEINPSWVVLEGVPDSEYRQFLRARYDVIEALNVTWAASYTSFEQIRLPRGEWLKGTRKTDYHEFKALQPNEALRLIGPEYAWRQWLQDRYGDVAALNAAHGASYAGFDQAFMPVAQLERRFVQENAGKLRRMFMSRNFVNVFDQIFLRGRPLINTMILCALAICTALIVNPLAGYALSRFRLPGSYKFLLLLMATMSFPPMVTMIPTFIMLREMNLLNTFFALVLPGAASGYAIFLLKGFFDSLPRDLYEAATIDGAGEIRMFFQISMALSKPILAVIALGAFNGAYMMFLYALIVCPREEMWTLSVWMYQWQGQSSMSGVFASVLIASIPTLLVFLLAQNIIMRGIVVPVEK